MVGGAIGVPLQHADRARSCALLGGTPHLLTEGSLLACSPGCDGRANGAASPQEPDPDRGCGDPLFLCDLLRRQTVHLLFKVHPIPGVAEVEDLRRIEGSQVNSDVAAELGQSLVASFDLTFTAMVVNGDCIYPPCDHSLVPELIKLLPSPEPGHLG